MSRLTNPNLDRTLSEKAYDFLGELILEIETKELLQELEREQVDGGAAEMNAFFVKQDKRNLESIRKYFRKQHYKHLFSKTVPKVAQIAAIVIAVITLLGSVAIATSHTVRVHVMKLLQNMEEEYTVVKMVEDESASFDVPVEWKGTSYMSYIPPNCIVGQVDGYVDISTVEYVDSKSNKTVLKFCEFGFGAWTHIDTQGAIVTEVKINEYVGSLVSKNETLYVYWCDGQKYYLVVYLDTDVEELNKIIRGVVRIN